MTVMRETARKDGWNMCTYCVTRDSSCVQHSRRAATFMRDIKQLCWLHGCLQNVLWVSLVVWGDFLCWLTKMPQLRTVHDNPGRELRGVVYAGPVTLDNLFSTTIEFVLAHIQIWNPFAQFKCLVYGHAQTYVYTCTFCITVPLVWGLLRLAPITIIHVKAMTTIQ